MRILALTLALLFVAATASAEPFPPLTSEEAKQHLVDGRKEWELGAWDAAIGHFEAGARLEDNNSWSWNLAQVNREAGKLKEARWHYERVIDRLSGDPDAAPWVEQAQAFIAEIEAEQRRQPIEAPPAAPASQATEQRSGFTTRRKIALGVGAGALVVVGVGVAFGIRAGGLEDDAADLCPRVSCDQAAESNALLDRAETSALYANVAYGVGAAAVAGALVLWFTGGPDGEPARAALIPRFSSTVAGVDVMMRF